MTLHTIKEGFTYQGEVYNILITLPEDSADGFKRNEADIKQIITTALNSLTHRKEFKPLSTRFIIPLIEAEKPKVSYKLSDEAEEDLSDVDLIDRSRSGTIADLLRTIPRILRIEQLAIHRAS